MSAAAAAACTALPALRSQDLVALSGLPLAHVLLYGKPCGRIGSSTTNCARVRIPSGLATALRWCMPDASGLSLARHFSALAEWAAATSTDSLSVSCGVASGRVGANDVCFIRPSLSCPVTSAGPAGWREGLQPRGWGKGCRPRVRQGHISQTRKAAGAPIRL